MKKVLITGASGLTGQAVYQHFLHNGMFEVKGVGRNPVHPYNSFLGDLCDKRKCTEILLNYKPDIIVHCAALAVADLCEEKHDLAHLCNIVLTQNLINYCCLFPCKLVFLSSDYVFDGCHGPYSEEAVVCPINYYGFTKAVSENEIMRRLSDYLIIRTTVIYGNNKGVRENFFSWVVSNLTSNANFNVVDSQYGNPTYNDSLAELILILVTLEKRGIYNAAGFEWVSRYHFACEIANSLLGTLAAKRINPISYHDLHQIARRPEYGGFKLDKIITELKLDPNPIKDDINNMNRRRND